MNADQLGTADQSMKSEWNRSYELQKSETLWPQKPVPFLDESLRYFLEGEGTIYLDFPCGDGKNLIALAKALPFVLGADSAPNALNLAAKALEREKITNAVLLQDDLLASRFTDAQFDGIFCCDVLGHLRNPSSAIQELLRILKPHRRLTGTVFSLGDSTRGMDMVEVGHEEYIYKERFYYRFYSREEVLELLKPFKTRLCSLELYDWEEPPHEGFREDFHKHESWVFIIEKETQYESR